MKALVLGGSGQTGKALLEQLSNDKRYSSLVAIGRREFSVPKSCKLITVDFHNIDSWNLPETPTHVYCSLGTTIKQAGSKEKFEKIDKDLVINIASFLKKRGTESFCYVSSMGANSQSSSFYLKMKGQTEEALTAIGFKALLILRPGLLLTKERDDSRPFEILGQSLMKLINPVIPESMSTFKAVDIELLASQMISYSVKGKSIVLNSAEIQKKLL
jgi:uncharacterized protein YbjT (DUF2867 family)